MNEASKVVIGAGVCAILYSVDVKIGITFIVGVLVGSLLEMYGFNTKNK